MSFLFLALLEKASGSDSPALELEGCVGAARDDDRKEGVDLLKFDKVAGNSGDGLWVGGRSLIRKIQRTNCAWFKSNCLVDLRKQTGALDRAKLALNQVKRVIFLSELQSKQWLAWCEEENIKLKSEPELIPVSVTDEQAFVAGISCSANTPAFSTEKMLEKRQLLRSSVRKAVGLIYDDML
ncbi:hypothetical protein ACH5RR_008123 [Cinchona calisaya]|uniref:Uncharacterized protein n=1 Tax=Cinchona calisaya TaxID=153742 RepID=A0ABD3AAM6_9GENT